MGTRTLVLTEQQWRQVATLINNAWHDADQKRMLTRPDSPQEKAAKADQDSIGEIQDKLAGRN